MLRSFKALLRSTSRLASIISIVFITYAAIITAFFYFTNGTTSTPKPIAIVEQNRKQIYKNLNNKKLQSSKSGRQQLSIYRAMYCGLLGEACTNNPADGDKNFEKSLFGFMTTGVTMAFSHPPASGIYWTYTGLQNSGFIPKSYAAQGIGFGAIQPISGLWKSMRDASLILIVLVLVTIGFLIMFRVKINAQTVVGLENALPRIFLSLLLIVFSFAIAGFLIDLMYVVTALGVTIIEPGAMKSILTGSTGKLFDSTFGNGNIMGIGDAIFSMLPTFLTQSFKVIISAGASVLLVNNVKGLENMAKNMAGGSPFAEGVLNVTFGFIISTLLFLVLQPAAPFLLSLFILITTGLVVFFRILILLFGAYVRILLLIIFAPFILLLEAIPGKKMFSFWAKRLVADLAAFPITAVLVVLSSKIADVRTQGGLWEPPFLSSTEPNAFPVLISIGLLFAIPNIIKKTKELMGIKSTGGFGPGLFFGGAAAGAGGGAGVLSKYMDYRYKASYLPAGLRSKLEHMPGFKGLSDESKTDALAKRNAAAGSSSSSGSSNTHP